jgi:hypothetical protein
MSLTLQSALDFNYENGVNQKTIREFVQTGSSFKPCAFFFVPKASTHTSNLQIKALVDELTKVQTAVLPIFVVTPNDCDVNYTWQKSLGDTKRLVIFINDTKGELTNLFRQFMENNVPLTSSDGSGPNRVVFAFNKQLQRSRLFYSLKYDAEKFDTLRDSNGKYVVENDAIIQTHPIDVLTFLKFLQ